MGLGHLLAPGSTVVNNSNRSNVQTVHDIANGAAVVALLLMPQRRRGGFPRGILETGGGYAKTVGNG
jgi:hypothetical protein